MVFKLFIFTIIIYLKKNLLKKNLLLDLKKKIEFKLLLSEKLTSILKFLNNNNINMPIENSNPASANKKNESE